MLEPFGTSGPELDIRCQWDKLLDHGHRVIAFDPRGHRRSTIGSAGIGSESMAADDAAVLEHFDVRDGVLVGHSTGGFIAIRALVEHPELAGRLRGLVSARAGLAASSTVRRRTGCRFRCCKAASCNSWCVPGQVGC